MVAFPLRPDLPARDDVDGLLARASPLSGAHVLIIAPTPLALFSLLEQGGVAQAIYLRHDDHSSAAGEADVVLVPDCQEMEHVQEALVLARRVLRAGGRVVLRDTRCGRSPAFARLLAQHGFSAIRCRVFRFGIVITGDLPFFWQRTAGQNDLSP